jgi:hypothetical protein
MISTRTYVMRTVQYILKRRSGPSPSCVSFCEEQTSNMMQTPCLRSATAPKKRVRYLREICQCFSPRKHEKRKGERQQQQKQGQGRNILRCWSEISLYTSYISAPDLIKGRKSARSIFLPSGNWLKISGKWSVRVVLVRGRGWRRLWRKRGGRGRGVGFRVQKMLSVLHQKEKMRKRRRKDTKKGEIFAIPLRT